MVYGHINLLIAKIKAQFDKNIQNISTAHTIVELCAIRDANCDVMQGRMQDFSAGGNFKISGILDMHARFIGGVDHLLGRR